MDFLENVMKLEASYFCDYRDRDTDRRFVEKYATVSPRLWGKIVSKLVYWTVLAEKYCVKSMVACHATFCHRVQNNYHFFFREDP